MPIISRSGTLAASRGSVACGNAIAEAWMPSCTLSTSCIHLSPCTFGLARSASYSGSMPYSDTLTMNSFCVWCSQCTLLWRWLTGIWWMRPTPRSSRPRGRSCTLCSRSLSSPVRAFIFSPLDSKSRIKARFTTSEMWWYFWCALNMIWCDVMCWQLNFCSYEYVHCVRVGIPLLVLGNKRCATIKFFPSNHAVLVAQ